MNSKRRSVLLPLLLVILVIYFLGIVDAVHSLDVFRLIQFDKLIGDKRGEVARIGTQRSFINLAATTIATRGSLSRRAVLLPFSQFDNSTLTDIINRGGDGILVLFPLPTTPISTTTMEKWKAFENILLDIEIRIPIYFAYADQALNDIYERVLGSGTTQDSYHLNVASGQPVKITDAYYFNFHGWLQGADKETVQTGSYRKTLNTIALIASYDTFSVVPDLSYGVETSGTSVVALLELARIFSKLYHQGHRTQGRYNIVFVLVSASTYKNIGLRKWIEERHNSGELENIDFALCLDTITDGPLQMHIPKLVKEWERPQRAIFQAFNSTAHQMGLNFNGVSMMTEEQKNDPLFGMWPHETFQKYGNIAVTLSSREKPTTPLRSVGNGIFDTKAHLNVSNLEHTVQFLGESLAKIVFGLPTNSTPDILRGAHSINSDFLNQWINSISSTPRMVPFISPNSIVLKSIENTLAQFTIDSLRETYPAETKDVLFYGPTTSIMSAAQVKPFLFDILLSIIVASYLSALFVYLKGKEQSITLVTQFFVSLKSDIQKSKKKV